MEEWNRIATQPKIISAGAGVISNFGYKWVFT
jgi:hypothetical protein